MTPGPNTPIGDSRRGEAFLKGSSYSRDLLLERVILLYFQQPTLNAMQTTDRSQTDRSRKRPNLNRDASNFDDYMLALVSAVLVGGLIVL
jgi:hypothetical protein